MNNVEKNNGSAKTARITILTTPEFKSFLEKQADDQGISVGELVRLRCLSEPFDQEDEQILRLLIDEVNDSINKASASLDKGNKRAEEVLNNLNN
ncbi:hypothetical protein [Marinicella sp. W31]|uniref:hypothetical protein n=1 Tax=Marinicella sp. W31 TaxID=3023713 RepID=UPI003756D8EF